MEEWKRLELYPKYEISNTGRIRHIKHQKIRKTRINSHGYPQICLRHIDGRYKTPRVHRLVAETFLGANNGDVVDHIDRDRSNPSAVNLRIVTMVENSANRDPLTVDRIQQVIYLYESGMTAKDIHDAL